MGLFGSDPAARIASRILQDGPVDDEADELFGMSIRIPSSLRAFIDELAEHAGTSRNLLATDLLRAGAEDVLGRLPPQLAEEIRIDAQDRL